MSFDFTKRPYPLAVANTDSNYSVACHAYTHHGGVLTSAIIAGPEQKCIGLFSCLVQGAAIVSYDGKILSKSEFRYRRHVAPIKPASMRWITLLAISKDPRILWNDDDACLLAGLKKMTTTPLLSSWVKYIKHELTRTELLKKLEGVNACGSILLCSTEELDGIVSSGLRGGNINIKG